MREQKYQTQLNKKKKKYNGKKHKLDFITTFVLYFFTAAMRHPQFITFLFILKHPCQRRPQQCQQQRSPLACTVTRAPTSRDDAQSHTTWPNKLNVICQLLPVQSLPHRGYAVQSKESVSFVEPSPAVCAVHRSANPFKQLL